MSFETSPRTDGECLAPRGWQTFLLLSSAVAAPGLVAASGFRATVPSSKQPPVLGFLRPRRRCRVCVQRGRNLLRLPHGCFQTSAPRPVTARPRLGGARKAAVDNQSGIFSLGLAPGAGRLYSQRRRRPISCKEFRRPARDDSSSCAGNSFHRANVRRAQGHMAPRESLRDSLP